MMGRIEVAFHDGPLGLAETLAAAGAGAVLSFEGRIRPIESGRPVDAICYEDYQPMATRELRRLAEETVRAHGLLALRVEHSRGIVAVGEVAFRLMVASPHRHEALAAMTGFLDRLKRDIPIWKRPLWREVADAR